MRPSFLTSSKVSDLLIQQHIFWQLHLVELLVTLGLLEHLTGFETVVLFTNSVLMKFHFVFLAIFCNSSVINVRMALDCKSSKGNLVNPGAPQGSILGPMLLPLHINGFPDDAICNTGICVHRRLLSLSSL